MKDEKDYKIEALLHMLRSAQVDAANGFAAVHLAHEKIRVMQAENAQLKENAENRAGWQDQAREQDERG